MLSYIDLKPGRIFVFDKELYQALEFNFLRMQQRKPVAQIKMKNLITGKILTRNFHPSDIIEEAEIIKETVRYLYNHRGQSYFSAANDPSKRFSIEEEKLGKASSFLKTNTDVVAIKFNDEIINIEIPIKVDLRVKETPPGERGNTAQGGTKPAILETNAKINVPLFINNDDIIRVNTETGEYTERVEKA